MKRILGRTHPRRQDSFTLVEMLVAIAVLSLMIAAMAQMTQLVGSAWGQGSSRIDGATKSRAMLDLVVQDLQRGVFRGDIPSFLTGATSYNTNGATYFISGTYTNAFYTRVPGIDKSSGVSVRDVSLVGYSLSTVNQGVDKISLERSDLDVPWTGGASQIAFGSEAQFTSLLPTMTPRSTSAGVVGFQMMFRRQDGSVIPSSSYTGEDFVHGPVVAIGVGVAIVGKLALTQMSSAQVAALSTQVSGITVTTSPKAAWDQSFESMILAENPPYPKSLSGDFRTYERWIACQPF
jgi:hypothetical protein